MIIQIIVGSCMAWCPSGGQGIAEQLAVVFGHYGDSSYQKWTVTMDGCFWWSQKAY